MLSQFFKEMKEIRANGGIRITSDFGNDVKHNFIAILFIQFIIGNCKGNDLSMWKKGRGLTINEWFVP